VFDFKDEKNATWFSLLNWDTIGMIGIKGTWVQIQVGMNM
jgi:hypothetical protein